MGLNAATAAVGVAITAAAAATAASETTIEQCMPFSFFAYLSH